MFLPHAFKVICCRFAVFGKGLSYPEILGVRIIPFSCFLLRSIIPPEIAQVPKTIAISLLPCTGNLSFFKYEYTCTHVQMFLFFNCDFPIKWVSSDLCETTYLGYIAPYSTFITLPDNRSQTVVWCLCVTFKTLKFMRIGTVKNIMKLTI